MLRGERITLRLVTKADLPDLHAWQEDVATRGAYFPLGVTSEPGLQSAFGAHGFWKDDEGMLLIVDRDDVVGEIEFFPISSYLQGYELSYQLFDPARAGKGYTTEAVRLLVDYLFETKRVERMQLNIHPANEASKAIARKCGFTLEGVMRACWFRGGVYHDLEIWSLLRSEASTG